MSELLPKIETARNGDVAGLLARRRRLELDRLEALRQQEEEAKAEPSPIEVGSYLDDRAGLGLTPASWWRKLERDRLALLKAAQASGAYAGPGAEGMAAAASLSAGGSMGGEAGQIITDVQDGVKAGKTRVSMYAACTAVVDIPPLVVALHFHKLMYDGKIKKGAAAIATAVEKASEGKLPGPGAAEGGANPFAQALARLGSDMREKAEKLAKLVNFIIIVEWLLLFVIDAIVILLLVANFVVFATFLYLSAHPTLVIQLLWGQMKLILGL